MLWKRSARREQALHIFSPENIYCAWLNLSLLVAGEIEAMASAQR